MKFGDDSSINGKWRNNPEESFTIVSVTSIYLFLRKKKRKRQIDLPK